MGLNSEKLDELKDELLKIVSAVEDAFDDSYALELRPGGSEYAESKSKLWEKTLDICEEIDTLEIIVRELLDEPIPLPMERRPVKEDIPW